MPFTRRIPLNPCDYLYYAHHKMLHRTVGSGNIAYMVVDVVGHPVPDRVREALAAAMAVHPVTMAGLRVSLSSGRPYWRIPVRTPGIAEAAREAADASFVCEDLRDLEDWETRLEALSNGRYGPDWDLKLGPQIHFEQYLLPNDRTRFCIRWPHLLMDAEGAQLFLSEIGRLDQVAPEAAVSPAHPLPDAIAADDRTIDPLSGEPFSRRWRLFRDGFSVGSESKAMHIQSLIKASGRSLGSFGLLERHWGAEEVRRIQASGKRCTPPGALLYARYLSACVIRALHRLHVENSAGTDAYLITLPLRVRMRDASGGILKTRPVSGNYIVAPTLYGIREHADDKAAIGADILRQLTAYHDAEDDLKQWSMVRMASYMRASFYGLLFRLPLGFERLCSGFSYYGEAERRVLSIGGAEVSNTWGGGPLGTPPGWNPVFSRYGDRLNLSFTWNRPDVPDDLAHRYVALIEEEIMESR